MRSPQHEALTQSEISVHTRRAYATEPRFNDVEEIRPFARWYQRWHIVVADGLCPAKHQMLMPPEAGEMREGAAQTNAPQNRN
jgi:hypothetical protein